MEQLQQPISVCLLISSLEFGGAERQVVELIRSFDRKRVNPMVCSLSPEVPLASLLPGKDQELCIVERHGRFDVTTVFRAAAILRQRHIDVVHAFLPDAEIVARLAAPLAGVPVVIASERNADYVRPLLHTIALKATQPLFDVMVANTMAGKRFDMRSLGLSDSRIEVIHNGVNVDRFCPDRQAGLALRSQLGIPTQDPLIGMVGSFKRQKGHDCFLRMAAQLKKSFPNATFLIAGAPVRVGFEAGNQYEIEIKQMAAALNLGKQCRFIGNQKDMKAVYNACDLTVLLSRREGTPNVVLESMACSVPVIVSDVADNSLIVQDGKTGFVVPREDSDRAATLAETMLRVPADRMRMGAAARQRVCEEFSVRKTADKLEALYARCLARKLGRSHDNGSFNR